MKFEGKLQKNGGFWVIEVPALDVMTQGRTKKEAYTMMADALELLVDKKGFSIRVEPGEKDRFYVSSHQTKEFFALFLKRQRVRRSLTLSQVARHLGMKSLNAYAQYEQAKSEPSLSQIQKFLRTLRPNAKLVLTII